MKALFTPAVAVLLMLQISCASSTSRPIAAKGPSLDDATVASARIAPDLPTPEVAVMPMKEGVLIAWKPIDDADGYFVYRETSESKSLLGIGPREAQGFIDRNPPEAAAKYSVQAFKLSAPSEKQETQALPGSARQSQSDTPSHVGDSRRVSFPM
jgi:hypothetical protein